VRSEARSEPTPGSLKNRHHTISPRRVGATGAEPPEDPRLSKGGFWVLHTAGGAPDSAERHRM
jgi:hypothetical protein